MSGGPTLVRVPFSGAAISLVFEKGFPFVPVAPVCNALSIDLPPQLRRIGRRVTASGLPARFFNPDGWAVPLEDLSWFLRTLRPAKVEAGTLRNFRDNLPRFLITACVELQGRYLVPRADRAFRYSLPNAYRARVFTQSRQSWARFTTADAEAMKRLRQDGLTLQQIGQRYRCSPTTVSLITNDKYALYLKPEPPEGAETLGEGDLKGVLAAEKAAEGLGSTPGANAPQNAAKPSPVAPAEPTAGTPAGHA